MSNKKKQKQTTEEAYNFYNKIIDDVIIWLLPKIGVVNKEKVDKHKDNYFVGEFLIKKYGISRKSFNKETEKFPSLFEKLVIMKEMEEYKLANNGLNRKADGSMVKFILSNKYGYSEKTENKNTTELKGDINLTKLFGFED